MSLVEIIALGYIVNIFLMMLNFVLIVIQSFIKMSFLDSVDKMKVVVYQQSTWNEYLSVKKRMEIFKLNALEAKDFGFLFPFASILEFLEIFWHFLKFDLDVFIFERMKDKTQKMKNKIKEYKEGIED